MTPWHSPSSQPILDKDRVHIWRANLDVSPAELMSMAALLSADEIDRANQFRFAKHKRRFIVARSILRQLLSNYLDLDPQNIKFDYGDRGKPHISESNKSFSLEFNVSHSHEYALLGFTTQNSIGVDIEHLRVMPDAAKIAQRFFAPKEFELIKNLAGEQQSEAFFKLWTAKEAYLKATGMGLSGSLANVMVDLESDFDLDNDTTLLMAIDGDPMLANSWSIYFCIPTSDYIGSVAIQTQISRQKIDFLNWHQSL